MRLASVENPFRRVRSPRSADGRREKGQSTLKRDQLPFGHRREIDLTRQARVRPRPPRKFWAGFTLAYVLGPCSSSGFLERWPRSNGAFSGRPDGHPGERKKRGRLFAALRDERVPAYALAAILWKVRVGDLVRPEAEETPPTTLGPAPFSTSG